jgi:Rieske Fe-S protein
MTLTPPFDGTPRRAVLGVAMATGAACAGCTTYGAKNSTPPPAQPATPGGTAGSGGSGGSSAAPNPATQALTQTSKVPVGGGTVLVDRQIVVTQPTAGVFKAFTAVCTHAGCTVSQVQNGTIICPCHGSRYHVADGSVANGPAQQPLAPINITVSGGEILQA